MAMNFPDPNEYRLDDGSFGYVYPIPEHRDDFNEILYDKQIQKMSYLYANIVAVFTEWFKSFFENDYFKFTRIRTESAYSAFKSFMKQIYKKDKPFLIIDPSSVEHVEDSLFGQNMINRYNMYDPDHESIGAKLLYSLELMESDLFELRFRRNRYKFEFEIMIMERTVDRQMNLYNSMLMHIRHNSKFMLNRIIADPIPLHIIRNIAETHGMDYKSDEFLEFVNSVSHYPIIKRIFPNGQWMFFMKHEVHIQAEVPGYPSMDSAETSEAIEWGARLTDSFTFIVDMPSEFIFLVPDTKKPKKIEPIEEPNNIFYISPIYADIPVPKMNDGYTLTNKVDIMIEETDNQSLNLLGVIEDTDKSLADTIHEMLTMEWPVDVIIKAPVYMNGEEKQAVTTLHQDGTIELVSPSYEKLYTLCLYLNMDVINDFRNEVTKKYIGDIEKY